MPVTFARTWPVQRTLKVSAAMPATGAPEPQSKFTVGSSRVTMRAGEVRVVEVVAQQPHAQRDAVLARKVAV